MAFQDVSSSNKFKKLTELKEGESLTGYVVGASESTRLPGAFNLLMNIDGERFEVSAAGNVKYMIKDGKIKAGPLTRITRQADVKTKGKVATRYKVEQDLENVLTGIEVSSSVVTQAPKTSMSDKLAALKG